MSGEPETVSAASEKPTLVVDCELLARCIEDKEGRLFQQIFESHKWLIADACSIYSGNVRAEFLEWFTTWVYTARKLPAVYRRMRQISDASSVKPDEYVVFKRILRKVVKSGYFAFIEEIRGKRPMADGGDKPFPMDDLPGISDPPLAVLINDEKRRELQRALSLLSVELRAPFVLTMDPGFLTDEDYEWLAGIGGRTVEDLKAAIDREDTGNPGCRYPLSAEFIGSLMGIKPNNVAQRVRRARIRLQELLKGIERSS